MYNGIGLETARGSGTNGYVQRNLSFIRRHKDKVDYKSEEELKKIDAQMMKGPNKDILDHERKRKVELKCMEMQELMEEQGYGDDEIERKVSTFRQMLMEKIQETTVDVVEKDEAGRPIAKATHQIAEANQARNEQLKAAFGLSEFYKEGSSMDPQRKAKEEAAKALAMAQKKYTILPEEDDADQSQSQPSPKKSKHKENDVETESSEKEKKKKRRHDSASSPSPERRKSRKTETMEQPRDREKGEKVKEREREKEKGKTREGKHRRERSRSSSVPRKKKRSSRSRSCSEENSRKKHTRSSPPASKDKRGDGKSRR